MAVFIIFLAVISFPFVQVVLVILLPQDWVAVPHEMELAGVSAAAAAAAPAALAPVPDAAARLAAIDAEDFALTVPLKLYQKQVWCFVFRFHTHMHQNKIVS
jgi:hypothetical protein